MFNLNHTCKKGVIMIGIDFYKWYLENPKQAIVAFLIMICFVIFGLGAMKYNRYKENTRQLQEELFKLKYKIK